ncbi:MAG: twin-arginine translocation signal domain-containing protein, partial [Armatimonadetes bacterium]|nr:twin-arginine translocation signal domain-containing protein [Armatimonadota bacterium]
MADGDDLHALIGDTGAPQGDNQSWRPVWQPTDMRPELGAVGQRGHSLSRRDFLCRVGMAAACACCLPDLLKHLGAASLSAPSSVAQPYRSRMTK